MTLANSNNTLPDDGDWTETCWSCFNVNFNILLKQIYCASVGKQETLIVSRCKIQLWKLNLLSANKSSWLSRYKKHECNRCITTLRWSIYTRSTYKVLFKRPTFAFANTQNNNTATNSFYNFRQEGKLLHYKTCCIISILHKVAFIL